MKHYSIPDVRDVRISGGLLGEVADKMMRSVIPYQWELLNDRVDDAEPSHCIKNFKIAAGEAEGEYAGFVFQDSDLAKWLEAAAYSLMIRPDAQLERTCDEAIALIGRAQQPDGYLNTYYTIKEPGKRWTNLRDNHELYCAGHMMEAACAYCEATGKRELLDIMTRMAHHIDSVIGPEEGKLHGYPGHEEIELALVRMYHATGDEVMLKLARYFIDQRGQKPYFFVDEAIKRGEPNYFDRNNVDLTYWQSHLPVREQTAPEGHAVRAMYLATGMADVARETGDEQLLAACRRLFDNTVTRRMYVTGGVGSSHVGEAFTYDYDLPNDTVYAETCASIALCFFARAMMQLEPDGKYADAMERALYNTCLAGMSLDGQRFFYVNPLEVCPEASHKDARKQHVLPVRPKWFGCACCPPNLARLTTSLAKYAYTMGEGEIYVNLYVQNRAELELGSARVSMECATDYPASGEIALRPGAGEYALCLRIPAWAREFTLTLNGERLDIAPERGYVRIARAFSAGDEIRLSLPMPARRVYASARVREDIGKVAIMRGPVVYCLEQPGNGELLQALCLPRDAVLNETARPDKLGGIVEISAHGKRIACSDELYSDCAPTMEDAELTFIPYYTWANRGENEMSVYVREI